MFVCCNNFLILFNQHQTLFYSLFFAFYIHKQKRNESRSLCAQTKSDNQLSELSEANLFSQQSEEERVGFSSVCWVGSHWCHIRSILHFSRIDGGVWKERHIANGGFTVLNTVVLKRCFLFCYSVLSSNLLINVIKFVWNKTKNIYWRLRAKLSFETVIFHW